MEVFGALILIVLLGKCFGWVASWWDMAGPPPPGVVPRRVKYVATPEFLEFLREDLAVDLHGGDLRLFRGGGLTFDNQFYAHKDFICAEVEDTKLLREKGSNRLVLQQGNETYLYQYKLVWLGIRPVGYGWFRLVKRVK